MVDRDDRDVEIHRSTLSLLGTGTNFIHGVIRGCWVRS